MDIDSVVISQLSSMVWAVHPGMLDVFTKVINNKLTDQPIRSEIVKSERVSDKSNAVDYEIINETAIIPVHGIFMDRAMGIQGMSGLVTKLNLETTLKYAADDSRVKKILLDINSPGGTVAGTMEVAHLVREIGRYKQVEAYADSLMASALYWIGSAAHKVYAYKASNVGSIGVYQMHIDQSAFDKEKGIKVTYINAGSHKVDGNPHSPLDDESTRELQSHVDQIYDLFINDVAEFRGRSVEYVRDTMADGRVFIGERAKEVGLVDEIKNIEGIIDDSNTYSFLKGEVVMPIFGKKSDEEVTVATLKENYPDLYKAVYEEGVAASAEEISVLKEEIKVTKTKLEKEKKIRTFAADMQQAALGEQLISEDVSVEDAYVALAKASKETEGEEQASAQNAFESTAPKSAGMSQSDELDGEEPQNYNDAVSFVMRRDDVSRGLAAKTVRREFPQFIKSNPNSKEGK